MRLAILSDVHGNLEALVAVLEDAAAQAATEFVCLGDVVGYGPDSGPCLDLILETCRITVAGNHDQAASGVLSDARFNSMAKAALDYARAGLSLQQQHKLRQLPMQETLAGLLLVHSSPVRPEEFPYVLEAWDARGVFRENQEFKAAVYGHTHVAVSFHGEGDRVTATLNPVVDLKAPGTFLCNVGSVGQPRDRDPRSCYAMYDSESGLLSRRRVEYDREKTAAKIEAAGLPEFLGQRLLAGT